MPPAEPVIPFYSLVLSDLIAPKAELVVWCGACRREARVGVVDLIGKLGPKQSVRDAGKRMTCSGCRRRGWGEVRAEWL